MPETPTCEICGSPRAQGALDGQCAACLLGLGLPQGGEETGSHMASAPPSERLAEPREKVDRFFGDYELIGEIARGGMGVVYKARQRSLNRLVAVKMILDAALGSKGAIRRFQNEAEAAAKLHHPNIVPIHEVGEHHGRHFLSMELIEGSSLADGLPTDPTSETPSRTIARLISTIARAVQHAHERGVLHRDLKPGNILIDPTGQPHIMDFGLAKLIDHDSRLTVSGSILGTPAYMAPEQAAGTGTDDATTAVDVYGLGAILYFLMVGRAPFEGRNLIDTMRRVVEEQPGNPLVTHPALPRDLVTICLKCLQKSPEARYRSAAELADDLDRFVAGEIIVARSATPVERLWSWCRREPKLAALSLSLLLLLSAFGILAPIAIIRIKLERDRVIRAGQEAEHRLFFAYTDQARALRKNPEPGWRAASLEALHQAARIGEVLSLPLADLRTEAVMALVGRDVRRIPREFSGTNGLEKIFLDPLRERYLVGEPSGQIAVRSWKDQRESMRLLKNAAFNIEKDQVPVDRFWAVSPDGYWLSARFADGSLRLRPISQDRGVWQMGGLGNVGFGRTAFSPDSTRVAYAQEWKLLRIAWLTNLHQHLDVPFPANLERFQWSPAHERIAAATVAANHVDLISTTEGRVVRELTPGATIRNFTWHPTEPILAIAAGDDLVYWHLQEDAPRSRWTPVQKGVRVLQFTPDGRRLMVLNKEGQGKLLQIPSGRELLSFSAASDAERIQFVGDDKHLAITSMDQKRVELLEASYADLRVMVSLPAVGMGTNRTLGSLTFSENEDRLIALSGSNEVRWLFQSGQWFLETEPRLTSATAPQNTETLARGNTLQATTGPGGVVRLSRVGEGALLLSFPGDPGAGEPTVASLSRSERFFAIGHANGSVEIWDVAEMRRELGKLGLDW